jgi:hypothetical protein
LSSVRDLIGVALGEGWLDEGDVVGEVLPDFVKILEDKVAQGNIKRRGRRDT